MASFSDDAGRRASARTYCCERSSVAWPLRSRRANGHPIFVDRRIRAHLFRLAEQELTFNNTTKISRRDLPTGWESANLDHRALKGYT